MREVVTNQVVTNWRGLYVPILKRVSSLALTLVCVKWIKSSWICCLTCGLSLVSLLL